MFKNFHYAALIAVGVIAIVLLNLPPRAAAGLKAAVAGSFLPLFGFAASTQSIIDRATWSAWPRRALVSEVIRLQRENDELKLSVQQAADASSENVRLRSALQWKPRPEWKGRLRLARVIGREPTSFWRACEIDLGSRDGIQPELPVLTPEGLVGKVRSAGPNHSTVVLVGDPSCGVSVVIADRRDHGVIFGPQSGADPMFVDVSNLPIHPEVTRGLDIVTSGYGSVFPAGIRVGTVLESRIEGGIQTTARVRLAANLNRLEEVWVLMP